MYIMRNHIMRIIDAWHSIKLSRYWPGCLVHPQAFATISNNSLSCGVSGEARSISAN